jgi:hypothetical protein
MATSVHVLDAKLPISQKIMIETCSSAIYFKKLMPADRIAATMIPDRIRLLEEYPPPDDERYRTNIRVLMAPTNASRGTDQVLIKLMLSKMASEAPKAAPADTPRVYGYAKGF